MTYRIFSIVAYDDSDTMNFDTIYNKIVNLPYTYFIIKHDSDDSKLHYHISIYTTSPTTIKVISKKLDIAENYIKIKDDFGNRYNLKRTIAYLIHYDMKDKYNYNINDIITNNKDLVSKYYDLISGGNGESQELKEIILFLDNNKFSNSKDLLVYCIDNNLLKTFRKYSYYLNQIIKENQYERSLL